MTIVQKAIQQKNSRGVCDWDASKRIRNLASEDEVDDEAKEE